MLARISGGNSGIGYYLEHGNKQGREFSREELDNRVILDGDLSLTESVINSIPDNGQERYLHITLSFYEDDVSHQKLADIAQEYKELLMNAYHEDEFCFYAEAHLPKIKHLTDNKTGEQIERKPHIHIVIPETNLVSQKKLNPTGKVEHYINELDAIQEHINNKYNLVSPKDGVRVSDQNHANVLARCKGDFFHERHSEVKAELLKRLDTDNIHDIEGFHKLISEYGETKIYNKGKSGQYFGVKLNGEDKFTRLKSPVFSAQYITSRAIPLVKPTEKQIASRLDTWINKTSHEIKHIHPAGEKIRKTYAKLDDKQKPQYLREAKERYDKKHHIQREDGRQVSHQSRTERNTRSALSAKTIGLPRLPACGLVYGLNGRSEGRSRDKSELLLPAHEHSDLPAAGREALDSDRYLRRLQDRGTGRIAQNPADTAIKNALRDENDLPLMKMIRSEIEPQRFLSHLHAKFNIDPYQHTVTFAKDGSPRFRVENRNLNASDFLTKYLNLEWSEAKENLLDIWQSQKENRDFTAVKSRIKLTKSQAQERFAFLNEHKKWVGEQIKQMYSDINHKYRDDLRTLLAIRDKKEREVERGFILFKKLEARNSVSTIKKKCTDEINAHYNHWQPDNRGNNMALGDALKKIINNPVEGNSISSGYAAEKYSMSERIKRAVQTQEYVKKELTDLIPHKVSPKEIRYLDPKTTETVFVDKGEHVRISGNVTQDKTEAMLMYAKEKYGGVLRLSGTEEFKVSCAMAAAEKGMNIIFRPEKYHEMMVNRIEEMKAEQSLAQENTIERQQPAQERPAPAQTPEAAQERPAPAQTQEAAQERSDPEQTQDIQPERSVADLKEEAEKLALQSKEAQKALDNAVNEERPAEEISALTVGVKNISSQFQAVTAKIKLAETLEKEQQAAQPEAKNNERTLDDELNKLAEKVSKELNIDKDSAKEALEHFRFKDIHDFDERMSQPENQELLRNDAKWTHEQNEVSQEHERSHTQDQGLSR